jgi:hypothetical protein
VEGKDNRWSDPEKDMIRKLAAGDPSYLSRLLSGFKPGGVIRTTAGALTGGAIGGPAGALILPAIGEAASRSQAAREAAQFSKLQRLVDTGVLPVDIESELSKLLKKKAGGAALPLINPTRGEMLKGTAFDENSRIDGGLGTMSENARRKARR